jgi:Zn-finger nucleic acid-binding protein
MKKRRKKTLVDREELARLIEQRKQRVTNVVPFPQPDPEDDPLAQTLRRLESQYGRAGE